MINKYLIKMINIHNNNTEKLIKFKIFKNKI